MGLPYALLSHRFSKKLSAFHTAMKEIGVKLFSIKSLCDFKYSSKIELIDKKEEIIDQYLFHHGNETKLLYNEIKEKKLTTDEKKLMKKLEYCQ